MAEIYQPDLEDNYYVTNFHALAGFVVRIYKDLLRPEEFAWYSSICQASEPAQRLYIRLLTRKRSVFRLSQLSYPEIPDISAAAKELAGLNLCHSQPPADLDSLMPCFTKPELVQILDLSEFRTSNRVDLTTTIRRADAHSQARYQVQLSTADQWITVAGHPHWMLMQLCFFGNLYQDSSEFVLRQLGNLRYENYPLERATRAFTTRQQIEAHWRYFECETLFECIDMRSAQALLQLASELPSLDLEDANLLRRVDRLRNKIARQLERLAQHDSAFDLYKFSVHPPARERRVRLLMRQQQWQAANALLDQMLNNPHNEAEKLVTQLLNAKCQQAQGLRIAKRQVFKPASSKLILSPAKVRVEELAKRYFATRGECFYTENTLVNGVLGLLIWDITFHPLPGVFFNPFQSAPADFHQPEFSRRRAAKLQARFEYLFDTSVFMKQIQTAFETHYGKQNPLVRWQALNPDLLTLAIERIPATHWQALFDRILSDTKENTTGFPDLVLFPVSGGYEFIEIKGPGDTLQANQRRWMHYFDAHGIACRLVHVRYRASNPMQAEGDQSAP